MNLEVSFRNLSPRAEVNKRGQLLYEKLSRFLDPASEGLMTVSTEHGKAIVELVVQNRGDTFKAVEEHDELKAAMDLAFHTMESQLRRSKERRVARRHSGSEDDDGFERDVDEYEA